MEQATDNLTRGVNGKDMDAEFMGGTFNAAHAKSK